MTDIFLLLQVCSMSCGWGFWCYSWCGLEWFACFTWASVSPSKIRWRKWHLPLLLWWLILFLRCWSLTQARIIFIEFRKDCLLAGGSKCSAEKNPTFPVAVAEFHVSGICHMNLDSKTWSVFGATILYSGKIVLPEYTFNMGKGTVWINFVLM